RYQHADDMRADVKRLKRETESSRTGVPAVVDDADELATGPAAAKSSPSSGKQNTTLSSGQALAIGPSRNARWNILVPAVIVVVAALVGGGLFLRSRKTTALTERDTVVLA